MDIANLIELKKIWHKSKMKAISLLGIAIMLVALFAWIQGYFGECGKKSAETKEGSQGTASSESGSDSSKKENESGAIRVAETKEGSQGTTPPPSPKPDSIGQWIE
ncbi:MAG: hypothetical protein D3911_06240 [Candidatus Electrothrix sp. AW3_4]|nr:hypothetical protein [Candidatus Electrothrix gigas]